MKMEYDTIITETKIKGKIVKKGMYVNAKNISGEPLGRVHTITKKYGDSIMIWAYWGRKVNDIDSRFDEVKNKELDGNMLSEGGKLTYWFESQMHDAVFADTLDELKQDMILEAL